MASAVERVDSEELVEIAAGEGWITVVVLGRS
jgi:hypothetical protein